MRNLFVGCALSALVATAAYGQETTSTIRGSVTASGAPVAGATVEIVDVNSGTRSTTVTATDGNFNANGLRAGGPYTVTVRATGYTDASVTEIQTVAAQTFSLPIELQPSATGGSDEIVITAAKLPNARTVSQGPATVLNAAQIANVASLNRDIRDLSRRDPFARLDDTPTGGRAISFAGQNARYNRFSVDGVAITDNFGLNTDGLPSRRSPIPFDAIGQFQAKVAPFDVREGNFQGGSINIVLKSGTNDFHGTGFYARSGDEFVGDKTKNLSVNVPNFKVENYGAEIAGPIIKDKLFFMIAGERLRGGRPIAEGTPETNSGTVIPGITQAQVDQISQIAQTVYNYDTGGVQQSSGDKDDRLVAKIDANLSDTQRLALTYTYAKDQINLLNNTFTTAPFGLGLASNAYIQGNRLHTGVGQLNSEWSDSFSTEVRGFYKNYVRIQDPLLGRGFAQFRVCTNPTNPAGGSLTACDNNAGVVSFGPDNSRQTNQLNSETWGGAFQARLTMNDHDLRVFTEMARVTVFNSFLQNSAGNYYFDSIADFQNRQAGSLAYGNAIPTLVPDDAAAKFKYQSYVFGIMDSWHVTPELNVSYGARYDLYGMPSRPARSAAYAARYANGAYVNGVLTQVGDNTENISGLGLFQPRLGFDWKPVSRVNIRGGGGIFGGGTPDVYVSNSFSNTGVLTNSISSNRTSATNLAAVTCTTLTAAGACAAALNGVTGTTIPGAVNAALTNATVSTASTVNALSKNFKIPSQWRATISAEYTADLGPLGDNWTFGGDLLYSKVRNQVYFTDIRSTPILTGANALTPDGRQRYANVIDGAGSTNTNTDILLANTKKGRTYIAIARFDKSWDFGVSINGSFTYQDVKDAAPATSSTAGSNYSNGAFVDPNNVAYGISNDQVKYFFKYGVNFDHAFFGDYKSTIALFGETRIGHPYSYTFQDFGGTRSAVFGTTGVSSGTGTGGNRYLMYVPTVNDPLVQYSSEAYRTALNQFIDATGLSKYRGKVAPRNAFHSKWFTRFDIHLAQEIPTGLGSSRITLFADIENFTNFINKNWGQQREYVFPYNVAVTRVQCLTTTGNATPTGTAAPTGTVAASAAQACAQYRYSPTGGGAAFTNPADQVYVNQSLYSVRVGARFSF
ncbi:carboxypeptidase-like regulatory domain-containing protein [Sphingomonas sp. BIUV-7]|uniref:Carboxypeptidase-like regulatory domain-containing protein n=1 Tax=Sphingomonas natans TaxID=3063330 RepID=A0ABT8Y404_9SPHN|nr:carboxypeptidase-like regulatory domain-containing protein [Sphingomonas sp. BIUV-7]MDO6413048.1 carboxypeptidase-like regulatory domain-containing protein [Sphingomonas sp. BIUV-7]